MPNLFYMLAKKRKVVYVLTAGIREKRFESFVSDPAE